MASGFYNSFRSGLQKAQIADLSSAGTSVKCALMANTYTPNYATDVFWSDISANEVSGTNYVAGGVAVATKSVTTANPSVFDADDAVFANVTVTGYYAVLYIDTGNPATSRLLECQDFGSAKGGSGVTITVAWNATGIHSVG